MSKVTWRYPNDSTLVDDNEKYYEVVINDGSGNYALVRGNQTYLSNGVDIWRANKATYFGVNCQDEFISTGSNWVENPKG